MATDKLVDFDHVTDYISREAAIDAIWKPEVRPNDLIFDALRRACEEEVKHIPSADVRPVVNGVWERPKGSTPRSWIFVCSKCGDRAYFPVPKYFPKGCGYNYCPNCGCQINGGRK